MTISSARILVVDDYQINRLKMSRAVERLGYTALSADNGHEALAVLRKSSHDIEIDLVLLDIMMPEMDGYEVLATMKADEALRAIPVLVISALEETESVVKAIELGAEDYLPKNFDPVLLNARIGACLEKKRMRDLELEYLRQVDVMTNAASAVEGDSFTPADLDLDKVAERDDALGRLARVFSDMAHQVYAREQSLKQQLQELRIEIDEARQQQQVSSITGTDYFQDLRKKAGSLRARLHEK